MAEEGLRSVWVVTVYSTGEAYQQLVAATIEAAERALASAYGLTVRVQEDSTQVVWISESDPTHMAVARAKFVEE